MSTDAANGFRTLTLVPSSRQAQGVDATLLTATQKSYHTAFSTRNSPEIAPLNRGQVVAGKYVVGDLLGSGGMGTVYSVTHRDIKPDNVFLCRNAQSDQMFAKVLDFGIAKVLWVDTASGLTQSGAVIGTPEYLSPEQAVGAPDIDERTDIYSCGVLLYNMLTGELPHRADTFPQYILQLTEGSAIPLSQHISNMSPRLDAVVMRALARDRTLRYPDAEAFAQALQSYNHPNWLQQVPRSAALVGLAILLLVAGAAMVLWRLYTPAPSTTDDPRVHGDHQSQEKQP